MIINTGVRTDIPAFYSKWFINRIRQGYVMVRNPYYPKKVIKYELNPNVVDCIDFCTKNPEPMLKYLDELKNYNTFWYVTITPYSKNIEPNVPSKEKVIESFKKLSLKLNKGFIGWRYDPIFLTKEFDINRHIKEFEHIAKNLKGYTNYCVISFLDLYEKVKRNAPNLRPPTKEEQIIIAKSFLKIGKENNINIYTCCEGDFLASYGINCTGCKSKEMLEKCIGYKIEFPEMKNNRKGCNCLIQNDIGAYNSCGHLCRYCYANNNEKLVQENMKNHFENSPLLIGNLNDDDEIIKAKQYSYKIKKEQMNLFENAK